MRKGNPLEMDKAHGVECKKPSGKGGFELLLDNLTNQAAWDEKELK
jgi:hypothetical protein